MTNTDQSLAVVTVTYNCAPVLEPFLEDFKKQRNVLPELVVVDNNFPDEAKSIVRAARVPNLVLIENEENVGVAKGNNQGIEYAVSKGFEWILLLNNDTEFGEDLFSDMISAARETGEKVVVPSIRYFDAPKAMWYAGGRFAIGLGIKAVHENMGLRFEDIPHDRSFVEYAPTCCMLVHRSVFEAVGLMDERYFVYWDDTDFCYRLKIQGVRILMDSSLTLDHKVSTSTGGEKTDFSIAQYNRNQIYFIRKYFSFPKRHVYLLGVYVKVALRLLLLKDSPRECLKRFRAIAEGLRM